MRVTISKVCSTAVLFAAVSLASPRSVHADIILFAGNVPQPDENVLLNTGDVGNPLFGATNQTDLLVRFTGDEILTAPANGQARIQALDGFFTYLRIDLPGGDYTSLILNLDAAANGTVAFTGLDTDNQLTNFTPQSVGGSGSNYFTFTAIDGQRISYIEFTATVPLQFVDAAQFRIGGGRGVTVPEPTSLLLLGTGLGFVAWRRRRATA